MRYTDRSRIEKDWYCPRAGYWNYRYKGRGIVAAGGGFDRDFGTIVHDGVEGEIQGKPSIQIASDKAIALVKKHNGDEQQQQQWGAIAYGMVAGFMRSVWPKMLEESSLFRVESEMDLMLTHDLLFQAKPDLLMRNHATGQLWNWNPKTTGWINDQWVQSWQKAPQVQLEALASEVHLGEPIAGSYILGLYKGRKYDGRQTSVFAWGWRAEELPGILNAQFSYEEQRRKGWSRFLTTEYPGGVGAWVANMPEEILRAQFVQTDPIFMRRDVTDRLVAQIIARENQIAEALKDGDPDQETLDTVFPQHFDKCTPAFGFNCEYANACWVPWIKNDPIASGQFTWREPHHAAERKVFELREVA